MLAGNVLYGTTSGDNQAGNGSVFAINTDGTGFTNLHVFSGGNDGRGASGTLILAGNTLYGGTGGGGNSGKGTVFSLSTNGEGFTTIHSFSAAALYGTNSDGAYPNSLILSDKILYGTASFGGMYGKGTVFRIVLGPQINIKLSGAEVILSWQTIQGGIDYSAFTLQSAPTAFGTFTNVPGAASPYTNSISSGQQFFRLISN